MRKFVTCVALACLVAVSTSSCGGGRDKAGDEISNFDVHEVLKSASRSFEVTIDSSKVYLSVYTSIQWPVKFGDSDLQPLRDSLLSRMYRVAPGTDVDKAILDFISTDTIFGPDAPMVRVDSVPQEGVNSYEIEYTGKLMELTERTVTYQITASSYLGGAHPNYATYPFTYDLVNSCMLTPENVFKPGCDASLLKIIKEALAVQEGVSVSRLSSTDIFVDDLFVSPMIYLSGGGVIFHYNPYQIAPYYKGTIDVEVPAYELTPYLTQRADSLINQ